MPAKKKPKLTDEMPYHWRVQSFSKRKPVATCVAYVDSRDVQTRLDEAIGPESWQDKYYEVKGNLFCSIGIKKGEEWVWKSDCGTESNQDRQKGEASDAFKRAAVKWGIGRFLYDIDIEYATADKVKVQGNFPSVVDQYGKKVWDLTEHINSKAHKQKLAPKNPPQPPTKPKLTADQKKQIAEKIATGEITSTEKIEKAYTLTPTEKKKLTELINAAAKIKAADQKQG